MHIKNIADLDIQTLSEYMISPSFMMEQKLTIINIGNLSKEYIDESKQEFILKNIKNIPEGNLILFYSHNPDKRTKIFKDLKKESQYKEFNLDRKDIFSLLSKKYNGKIETNALQNLIEYKSFHIDKIESEIQKLLITIDIIQKKDIEENVSLELEESIFIFIESILNLEISQSLQYLETILNNDNIYAVYNSILANLRTTLYISKLKKAGKSSSEITQLLDLGKRSFLINKHYKISLDSLKRLYMDLISLDKKMKT